MNPVRPKSAVGIFVDTETTGLDPFKHRILEIALKIIRLDTGTVLAEYESVVSVTREDWEKASHKALEVNGFKWEEIEGKGKSTKSIAEEILALFKKHHLNYGNSFFYAYSATFDCSFFQQVIPIDIQQKHRLSHQWNDVKVLATHHHFEKEGTELKGGKLPSFSKDNVALRLDLPPEKKPHRAMNGVDHMLIIYEKIVGFKKL